MGKNKLMFLGCVSDRVFAFFRGIFTFNRYTYMFKVQLPLEDYVIIAFLSKQIKSLTSYIVLQIMLSFLCWRSHWLNINMGCPLVMTNLPAKFEDCRSKHSPNINRTNCLCQRTPCTLPLVWRHVSNISKGHLLVMTNGYAKLTDSWYWKRSL